MKYSEVLTTYTLQKKLERLLKEHQEKIMSLSVEVTEKIDGENFRVGIDKSGKEFIGQHKATETYYRAEDDQFLLNGKQHPRWNRFSIQLKEDIEKIFTYIHITNTGNHSDTIFFGELYGKGLGKGVIYDTDYLNVVWFDIEFNNKYLDPLATELLLNSLQLNKVPTIRNMTLQEFVDFDPMTLKPAISRTEHIEGIVAKPIEPYDNLWAYTDRLIVKNKIPEKSEGIKPIKKEIYESPFEQFAEEERLRHVIADYTESGKEVTEDKDCRMEIVALMVADIEKEANDHNLLPDKDRKIVITKCHRLLAEYYRTNK